MDRIKALPERTAYTVLLALCNDPSILTRAVEFSELLQPPFENRYDLPATHTKRRKRKSPIRYDDDEEYEDEFECSRCNKAIHIGCQQESTCAYHEGDLEPDYDGFWEDLEGYNEDKDGPIDTEEMRRRYPQGFFWDCCGKKINDAAGGCRTGAHIIPAGSSLKRSRVLFGDDQAEFPPPSPEPRQQRQLRQQQQPSPPENGGLPDNEEDDDSVAELQLQHRDERSVTATTSGGKSGVQVVNQYVKSNEVIDLESDNEAAYVCPPEDETQKNR